MTFSSGQLEKIWGFGLVPLWPILPAIVRFPLLLSLVSFAFSTWALSQHDAQRDAVWGVAKSDRDAFEKPFFNARGDGGTLESLFFNLLMLLEEEKTDDPEVKLRCIDIDGNEQHSYVLKLRYVLKLSEISHK